MLLNTEHFGIIINNIKIPRFEFFYIDFSSFLFLFVSFLSFDHSLFFHPPFTVTLRLLSFRPFVLAIGSFYHGILASLHYTYIHSTVAASLEKSDVGLSLRRTQSLPLSIAPPLPASSPSSSLSSLSLFFSLSRFWLPSSYALSDLILQIRIRRSSAERKSERKRKKEGKSVPFSIFSTETETTRFGISTRRQ